MVHLLLTQALISQRSQGSQFKQMRDGNNKKLEMGNEEEKRENEKWEKKTNLNPNPISKLISNSLFCSHFPFFSFPARFSDIRR